MKGSKQCFCVFLLGSRSTVPRAKAIRFNSLEKWGFFLFFFIVLLEYLTPH